MPLVAALGYVLAGLAIGLWMGERGRRAAAERTLTYGSPEPKSARPPTSAVPTREAEQRAFDAAHRFSEQARDGLARFILARAREEAAAGQSEAEGYTEARARQEADELIGSLEGGQAVF